TAEIAERRVARAKVVEGDAETGFTREFELLDVGGVVGHDHGLGELEVEPVGSGVGFDQLREGRAELRMTQLDGRDVDSDARWVGAFGWPRAALGGGFLEHPGADL